ncbi:MAG TPA: hypothetical protein VNG69_05445 [Casimicrobiaceae bacterium]|nr:hypothetical protein [Casimicrobiaceae bacterium]
MAALLFIPPAYAQSQAGGVPALDARVTTLEAAVSNLTTSLSEETAARRAADAALQAAVNALQTALAALQTSVNSGLSALSTQVTKLQSQLTTVSATVQSLDTRITSLSTAVNALEANRSFALFEHSAGSTNLNVEGFPYLRVVTAFVPPGEYVIYAHADIEHNDGVNNASACLITTGPIVSRSRFTDLSSAKEVLITDADSNSRVRMVLMSRASLSQPANEIGVECSSPRSTSPSSSITAIRVSDLVVFP